MVIFIYVCAPVQINSRRTMMFVERAHFSYECAKRMCKNMKNHRQRTNGNWFVFSYTHTLTPKNHKNKLKNQNCLHISVV